MCGKLRNEDPPRPADWCARPDLRVDAPEHMKKEKPKHGGTILVRLVNDYLSVDLGIRARARRRLADRNPNWPKLPEIRAPLPFLRERLQGLKRRRGLERDVLFQRIYELIRQIESAVEPASPGPPSHSAVGTVKHSFAI